MLLGFKCSNFRSIKDEQEITMFPGPTKNLEWHILKTKDGDGKEVSALKCALIFGANASGKSNMFKAMRYSSQVIIDNIFLDENNEVADVDEEEKRKKQREKKFLGPFILDPEYAVKPSSFEYQIEVDKHLIKYGFEIDSVSNNIISEWLKEFFVEKDDDLIFSRGQDGSCVFNGKKYNVDTKRLFIHYYKGDQSYPDKLSQLIHRTWYWFKNSLAMLLPNASLLWDYNLDEEENRKSLAKTLSVFDTGITGMDFFDYKEGDEYPKIKKNTRTDNEIRKVKKGDYGFFLVDEKGNPTKALRFTHGKNNVPIRMDQESDGTLRLVRLAPILIRNDKECVYILDEMDRYLHPSVVYAFIEWFTKRNYDYNKQLIVITHNPHLLDQDLVRRDEIWFAQKDNDGCTELYSLDDYNIRFDKKIEKAYYEGYFDGLPRILLPSDLDEY